jgi:hypothetical protein
MLRFLRQLRQNTLAGKQFRKYFLYALGEVLLVVVGILLALQIDTWNSNRILKKKELIYLKEIRVSLQDDFERIGHYIDFNQKKDTVIDKSLGAMLHADSNLEAMNEITKNMPVLAEFAVFTQNRVAFDNMLSAENIDLISSDTLRILLSSYYAEENLLEGTQERVKELTRVFVDHTTPMLMTRENIKQFRQTENGFVSGSDLDFKTNRVLFGDLFGMQRNVEAHSLYLKGYQKEIEIIVAQIDQFLNSNN